MSKIELNGIVSTYYELTLLRLLLLRLLLLLPILGIGGFGLGIILEVTTIIFTVHVIC